MNANIILPTLIAKSAVGIHTVFALRHFLLIFYNLVFVFLNQNSKRTRKEVDKKPQKTRIALEKNSKNTQIQLHRIKLERA